MNKISVYFKEAMLSLIFKRRPIEIILLVIFSLFIGNISSVQAVICSGGRVWNGVNCSCPGSSTWNGSNCSCPGELTFDGRGCSCTGGRIFVLPYNCLCAGDGVWDGHTCTCTGGRILNKEGLCVCPDSGVWNGYSCNCPSDSTWNGSGCTCSGGRILSGTICVCPAGLTWTGSNCVQIPAWCPLGAIAYSPWFGCQCPVGQIQSGNRCICPNNLIWNGSSCGCSGGRVFDGNTCSCTEGKFWDGVNCSCPAGSSWNGSACTCPGDLTFDGKGCSCTGGRIFVLPYHCLCAGDGVWNGSTCTCSGGRILNKEGLCVCPAPGVWNGSSCGCPAESSWNGSSCICSGGRILDQAGLCRCPSPGFWNGSNCVYPEGLTWNGTTFVCSGGRNYTGSACVCPAGLSWNGSSCSLIPLFCPQGTQSYSVLGGCQCPSGQIVDNNRCICPGNKTWDGNSCVCTGGRVFNSDLGSCACPGDTTWDGNNCNCTGGRIFNSLTNLCACPRDSDNTYLSWNGLQCLPCPLGAGVLDNGRCGDCPRNQYPADDRRCRYNTSSSDLGRQPANIPVPNPKAIPIPSSIQLPPGAILISNDDFEAHLFAQRMREVPPSDLLPASWQKPNSAINRNEKQSAGQDLVAGAMLGKDMLDISTYGNVNNSKMNWTNQINKMQKTDVYVKDGIMLENYKNVIRMMAMSIRSNQRPENTFGLYSIKYNSQLNRNPHLQYQLMNPYHVQNLPEDQLKTELEHVRTINTQSLAYSSSVVANSATYSNGQSNSNRAIRISCNSEDIGASNVMGDALHNNTKANVSPLGLIGNFSFPLKSYLTCVKNQGARGTCTAFATAAAFETQVYKKYNKMINLSEQALYFQGKGVLDCFLRDYDGYYSASYLSYSVSTGYRVPLEKFWNYNPGKTQDQLYLTCDGYSEFCSNSPSEGKPVCSLFPDGIYCGLIGQIFDITKGAKAINFINLWNTNAINESLNDIIATLMDPSNPIPVIFEVTYIPRIFGEVKNGYIDPPQEDEKYDGGHAMLAVGYISNQLINDTLHENAPSYAKSNPQLKDENGMPNGYFILKNSWSELSGDAGYYYIPSPYIANYLFGAYGIGDVDFVE